MTSLKSIGQKIAYERVKQKITQEDLAGMVEMDRSFLSYIENGHNNFSIEVLLKIAEALEVKSSKLLED